MTVLNNEDPADPSVHEPRDSLRAEFEAWAWVRDFDTTHSAVRPERYANERTQGAWQVWGHGTANWRDQRDTAVRMLRHSLAALEHHREQTRPIAQNDAVIDAIRRGLGIETPNAELCGGPLGPSERAPGYASAPKTEE